jgi:lantibiotic biosynthesis protein
MENLINEKFILRTPLLKLTDLVNTEEELLAAFQRPEARQALYIASRDLYAELLSVEAGEVKDAAKKDKILIGLYKYYTRMCTRCTPFGIFAGLNTGVFGNETSIIMGKRIQPRMRLDMDYLCNFFYELNKDELLYPRLIFYPNNTLYKVSSQWRYVEYQFKENTTRFHNLVSIDDNEVLTALITASANGCTYHKLKDCILAFDFEEIEAEQYLLELIRSQVLISNLYPSVSGLEYQYRLFEELEKLPGMQFENLNSGMTEIMNGTDSIIEKTIKTESFLKRFNVKINSNRLIQVDLLKEAEACKLPASLKLQVEKATRVLHVLRTSVKPNSNLERFKIAFYERYEDAFTPLSYVMDTDIGTGYKNAISIAANKNSQYGPGPKEQQIRALKWKLYHQALKFNLKTVELKEEDLAHISKEDTDPMPASYSIIGNVFAENDQLYIRLRSAGGSSAINLMGRFGHLHPEIETLCKELAAAEQKNYQNAILAEIVHLPQGRIGNIVTRPHYRNYEIPYLSFSTLPEAQQIPLDDLYVGVVNFRVVLFSKRLNKEIIPRLANAHNYQPDSLPVYHFLCDLQTQDFTPGVFWSWDECNGEAFLPRVTYKNIVLSPARWLVSTALFKNCKPGKDDGAFQEIIRQEGLPDKILLPKGDNELYIDLKSPLGISTFLNYCRKNEKISIEEFLYNLPGNGLDGYSSEIIIPCLAEGVPVYRGLENIRLDSHGDRNFVPTSEWVYIKLYTGKTSAEKLLLEVIPGLIDDLKEHQIVSKWFFIRFADPKHHLRIRVLISQNEKREQLLQTFNKHLRDYVKDGIIWDFQLGTYRREMERYGWDTIEETESLFNYNSELVLRLLPLLKPLTDNEKLSYVISYVDRLLSEFEYSIAGKLTFSQLRSVIFNKEFGITSDKTRKEMLNGEFRSAHSDLKNMLKGNGPGVENALTNTVNALYQEHMKYGRNDLQTVISKHRENKQLLTEIAASYIHMFVNRVFKENQRYSEMTMYYFMVKYYSSEIARNKKNAVIADSLQELDRFTA